MEEKFTHPVMKMDKFQAYIHILQDELIPAHGCTEPIAVAYCGAKAAEVLAGEPTKMVVEVSSNIIKNVKSVVVPNTNGLKGIETAAVFGAIAGDGDKQLEVLVGISDERRQAAMEYLQKSDFCQVRHLKSDCKLHIIIRLESLEHSAMVEIKNEHTNICRIERDGQVVFQLDESEGEQDAGASERSLLNVDDIIDFATHVDINLVAPFIERQIQYNTQISQEGLQHSYGANVGSTLLKSYGNEDVRVMVRAAAAAGSDARMSGSSLPVIINSGSGNQGMTASLPVIVYAQSIGTSHESLVRALLVSNLIAIHQKTKVGRLSAYCGAVSAATGSGAAIAWLDGHGIDVIKKTITNSLANVSGIICDGAKPSCAAKIASSIDAAMMGYELAKADCVFLPGEGIVKSNVESTISGVGDIASKGMVQTDDTIIDIMIAQDV